MADSIIFISHKHSDSKIAQVLGSFVEERSNGNVKVHLSSSPEFRGPKFGKSLNAQLRDALWNTDVLLLVYTSADQDWQYCMWECDVATHPQSPDTNIVVFQCGSDVPAPFQDVLRVNVRRHDDIKRFTRQFLRDPEFFPKRRSALAPNLLDRYVEDVAQDLYKKIGDVLPPIDPVHIDEWSAWPYLVLELARTRGRENGES